MIRNVFGESVQGASHIRTGKECQDSFRKIEVDKNTVILAVADGHGSDSCPYSRTGSYVAVNVFCKILGNYLDTYQGQPKTLLTFLNREGDTKVAQAIDAEWKRRILRIHTNYRRETPVDKDGNKDKQAIYKMYGSTLLGLVLTKSFLFAFQLGDGDIVKVTDDGVQNVIDADKILGTETHSLSKSESWKKAITYTHKRDKIEKLPVLYILSSDGMANSFTSEDEFRKNCNDYFMLLKEHGVKAVSENLKSWLAETSELGCGDDITTLFAYFSE